MSQATIRTRIYTIVSGVSDVGKVYDYQRFANEYDTYLNLFKTAIDGSDLVRAWMVGYDGFAAEEVSTGDTVRRHQFRVYGLERINDAAASEKAAAELAESICNALDTDATLHGYLDDRPSSIELFGYLQFGSVFCHSIEIVVTVSETAAITR